MVSSESVRPPLDSASHCRRAVDGDITVVCHQRGDRLAAGALGTTGGEGRHDRRAAWLYHGYAGLRDKWHLGPIPCVDGLPYLRFAGCRRECCGAGSTGDFLHWCCFCVFWWASFWLGSTRLECVLLLAGTRADSVGRLAFSSGRWCSGPLRRTCCALLAPTGIGSCWLPARRCWRWQADFWCGGCQKAPPGARGAGAFPGRARGLPQPPFQSFCLGLFRPHVGSVRVLGFRSGVDCRSWPYRSRLVLAGICRDRGGLCRLRRGWPPLSSVLEAGASRWDSLVCRAPVAWRHHSCFTHQPRFSRPSCCWGAAVAGDSPQFSALTAHFAPREVVGSALTLVNSIGFSITIVSLSLLEWLQFVAGAQWLLVPLALRPLCGLIMGRLLLTEADAKPD